MNTERFRNLRELQFKHANGEEVEVPFSGRSRIFLERVAESQKLTTPEILDACITAGIFKPGTIRGENSFTQEHTGLNFVELSQSETPRTFNVAAKILSPSDPRRFTRSGNLEELTEATDINIISGTCLFSTPGVKAHLENGEKIDLCEPGALAGISSRVVEITVDERLQAYEADTVLRLTTMMSSINSEGRNVNVSLSIPRVEYLFYMLDAYEKGLVSQELVNEWIGFVDERSQRMEAMMRKRIPKEFALKIVKPLEKIEEPILRDINSGKKRIFSKTVDRLRNQSLAFRFAINAAKPTNFKELTDASYVVPYLIASQDESTLPIAIENPEEEPIFKNFRNALDGISCGFIVLYPHSNAIPVFEPKNGKVHNYHLPPEENNSDQLNVIRDVVILNRQS